MSTAAAKKSTRALVAHQTRYDLRAFRRDRQGGLTTVLLPILLLVAFVGLAGHHAGFAQGGRPVSVAQFYVPGLIAYAIVAASFASLLTGLVTLRETGVLKRRRATPVPAWILIAGRTSAAAVVALGTTLVLVVIGRDRYDVRLAAAAVPGLALVIALGTAAFCCLAYAIAPFIRSPESAAPVIQIVLLPLYVISGVFLPDSKNPEVLRQIARALPLEPVAHGIHRAFDPAATGFPLSAGDIAVLLGWTVLALVIALKRFRWLPR